MDLAKVAGITAAALMTVAPPAFAQAQTKTTDIATTQTFTGCLMTEPAYRKAHNLGSGAMGGVGLGDELVLVDAKVSPASGATADAKATAKALDQEQHADKKAGTDVASGKTCADQGMAFRLTGAAEDPLSKMKNLLGQEVVIQGRFKDAKDAAMGGTPAADKLPAEVVIESFQPAPAATPVTEPPAAVATPQPVTPPPPPVATPAPAPMTTPAPAPPKELPHTAGSDELLGLVGAVTLFSGALVSAFRRRAS
jgi:hypothetical protein